MSVEAPDRSSLIICELDEMRGPRLAVGQMASEIRGGSRCWPACPRGPCCAPSSSLKGVAPASANLTSNWNWKGYTCRVDSSALNLKVAPVAVVATTSKGLCAGEGVPGKLVSVRADTEDSAGQLADRGKQNRRAPGPDSRITVPEQVAAGAVTQNGQLRAERIDRRAQVFGT